MYITMPTRPRVVTTELYLIKEAKTLSSGQMLCNIINTCFIYAPAFVINPVVLLLGEGDPCQELNCTENERCEEKHGVYGCSCKENHHRSQHDSFG